MKEVNYEFACTKKDQFDTAIMGELKVAFAKSDLPYRVDVLDYASASQPFRNIIMQEYEIIQQLKTPGLI